MAPDSPAPLGSCSNRSLLLTTLPKSPPFCISTANDLVQIHTFSAFTMKLTSVLSLLPVLPHLSLCMLHIATRVTFLKNKPDHVISLYKTIQRASHCLMKKVRSDKKYFLMSLFQYAGIINISPLPPLTVRAWRGLCSMNSGTLASPTLWIHSSLDPWNFHSARWQMGK